MSRVTARKTTDDRSMAIRAAPMPRPPLRHDSGESKSKQKSSPGKKDGKKNSDDRVTATNGKLFLRSGPNTSSGLFGENRKQSGQNNSTRASNVQPNEPEVAVGQQCEADPCKPAALDDIVTTESVSDASATSPSGAPGKAAELSLCRGIHGDGGSSAKVNQTSLCEIFIQGLFTQWSLIPCLISVLVISVIAPLVFRGLPEHSAPGDTNQKIPDFAEKLRQQFPEEEKRFISMVTAVYKAVEREPARPAVLLLLSNRSEDGKNTADAVAVCLARFIENQLTQKSTIIIQGADFYKSDGSRSKYDIDTLLKAHFSKQARVAALTGIEKLSLEAATVFYKYCDHESSEYKNIVLVLTALVQNAAVNSDDAITSTLLKSWQAVPDDVAPILSRVANNVLWPRSSRGLDCSVH